MIILGTNSIKAAGGFNVANSLRFNRGSSDNLTRSTGTATNNDKATVSFWLKRSGSNSQGIIAEDTNGSNKFAFILNSNQKIELVQETGGSTEFNLITTRVFRDNSAWYHIVIAYDSSQGTASNRIKVYVNGVQETAFDTGTYPSSNVDFRFNKNSITQQIGSYENTAFMEGYLSEFVLIDGQQLAPDQFGEFDSDSGIWKPIDVSGLTFGNNGFYLDFEDSSALGNDAAGSNNFTVNNLTAIDQSIDTCTNNFSTLNPLIYESRSNTFAEGNLKITGGGSDAWDTHYGLSTIAVSTGKWFVESKVTTVQSAQAILGLISTSQNINTSLKDIGVATVEKEGRITGGGNNLQTGLTAFSNGDIAGAAFDATNGTVQFYRNGSAYGNAISSIASDTYYFATTTYQSGGVIEFNFGSPPYSESGGNSDGDGFGNFSMAVPSGYFALNTKNLAEYG